MTRVSFGLLLALVACQKAPTQPTVAAHKLLDTLTDLYAGFSTLSEDKWAAALLICCAVAHQLIREAKSPAKGAKLQPPGRPAGGHRHHSSYKSRLVVCKVLSRNVAHLSSYS